MHLINQYGFWTDVLSNHKHLIGQDAHRNTNDYNNQNDVLLRVDAISNLITGNEEHIVAYIVERANRLTQETRQSELERLKIIGKYYFQLESLEEVNLLDDDIMQAWLLYVRDHKDTVTPHLADLKVLLRFPENKQLNCVRWGLVNYIYDLVIAALNLSKVPQFQAWFGIPISASPASTAAINVAGYNLLKKMLDWMQTPLALGLYTGIPSFIGFARWFKLRYPGWCLPRRFNWQNRYTPLDNEAAPDDPMLVDLNTRSLTTAESKALTKRLGWEVTTLVTIWLTAIKIVIKTYSNDTVDGFVAKIFGDVVPPGSIDYIFLMLQHWLLKMVLEYLERRSH